MAVIPALVTEFKKWTNFKGEPLDIAPHREKMVQRNLEQEFKKPDHPFRIAIVCAMWLTGFDVNRGATGPDDGAQSQPD